MLEIKLNSQRSHAPTGIALDFGLNCIRVEDTCDLDGLAGTISIADWS